MAPQQDTKFNTSFIPKKPVNTKTGTKVRKNGPNLFSMIGIFIFLISILGVAWVYFSEYQTEENIASQIEQLRKARSEFDEDTIASATRLNQRIIAVQSLLDNHVSPSSIFSILEEKTLKTVGYNTFNYNTTEEGVIDISSSGKALGFESVVLQSDELGVSDFRDVLFSNVQSNETGDGVSFSMNASIDKAIVLYKNNMDSMDREFETDLETFNSTEESASSNQIFR